MYCVAGSGESPNRSRQDAERPGAYPGMKAFYNVKK